MGKVKIRRSLKVHRGLQYIFVADFYRVRESTSQSGFTVVAGQGVVDNVWYFMDKNTSPLYVPHRLHGNFYVVSISNAVDHLHIAATPHIDQYIYPMISKKGST
jgi:hypothetical protein